MELINLPKGTKKHEMRQDKTIFYAKTFLSFGAGAKFYEFVLRGSFLMFRSGVPQSGGGFIWGIKDASENILKEIYSCKNGDLQNGEYLEYHLSKYATHFFKKNKWLSY